MTDEQTKNKEETTKANVMENESPTCGLGRALGQCKLRKAGCETLYDVLAYLYPPGAIVDELKRRNDLTPAATAWLQRLDVITNR